MSRAMSSDPKLQALHESGTANPRPEGVRDPLFQENAFFDARDLVQVKYEMLRRVRVDGMSVTSASRAFGFSRVGFYQTRKRFEAEGVAGLLPKPRGPQRAHKLSDEVMKFAEANVAEDPSLSTAALAELIQQRFGVSVHPRTIERALKRRGKKGRR